MTDALTLYQGDSSQTIQTTVYLDGVQVTGPTAAGYTGKFSLVKCLGDTPEFTGNMTEVSDTFRYFITPAQSAAVTPGVYIGVSEIENAGLDYKQEEHRTVTINKQGYTP